MFTGIIETLGRVKSIEKSGSNLSFWIASNLYNELKIDQSVAHNGVCLTVDQLNSADECYRVTAVDETLKKTNLGNLKEGSLVNLERCMIMNGRLDGHIVQGHVDTTASVKKIEALEGSWLFEFAFDKPEKLMVEKGSVCINGVSLTCFDVHDLGFTVTIIPYTYEHTNFKQFEVGERVNIEFDIIGKYVARLQGL
ncbi:riboflavin synthase [Luteibaculum oceani]|uniref:Riboflavin synthase n=1 Tax=Luteibaculum oceani TaxID=1294296 RepID=A0A5C6VLA5_9FLAO|nr:riboflavin synthase [Luteibaculum oceani]TXC85186.1 riboflavin synthase [Luteibaculum oceani]